jgi:hypothetical protein
MVRRETNAAVINPVDSTDGLERKSKPVSEEGNIDPSEWGASYVSPRVVPARQLASQMLVTLRWFNDGSPTKTQSTLTARMMRLAGA